MARIIYSGLVTSIRGSVGGTTFQNNAYGFTVKNKANMIRPNSAQQELRKLIFSKSVKAWGGLTTGQRNDWNAWAATYPQFAHNNPSSVLSGFAVFTKWHALNFLGFGLSVAIQTAPMYVTVPLDTVTYTLTLVGGVLTLNTNWVTEGEDWNVNISMSRPFLASQNFAGTSPRFVTSTSNTDDAIIITNDYLAIFGKLPSVGQSVFIDTQLFASSNGQVPAKTTIKVTVT